jgi:NADP-dependent 3-hydroxy acid dehydrogenase YdfG
MVQQKWGRIVNLGSSSSYTGFKNGSIYCTTKHAILGLSRSLHAELKEDNVRCYCISPSSTRTDMGKISSDQNFETFLDPSDVAESIKFVISFDVNLVIDEIRLNRMKIE